MDQTLQPNEENYSKQFEPGRKKFIRVTMATIGGVVIFFLLDTFVDGPWRWFIPLVFLLGIYLIGQIRCPKCGKRFPLWWHYPLDIVGIYKRCPRCRVILNENAPER